MAELLSDQEIRQILGTVIKGGDKTGVRPNSYVLRLGPAGEYLTTGKEFLLGEGPRDKKGIKVPPGQSVALTAFETIDFGRDTVGRHFPDRDLHALISPTTDLQREGVVAPTTQVDAGYRGTLNWTLSNSSSEERRFVFKERLFRLAIFKLEKGERPENLYRGAYQDKEGYVRSERSGAPVGMRPIDWEDSTTDEGPEAMLDRVIRSGFPWSALGTRLKTIDNQFQSITNEYAEIRESITRLEREVERISDAQSGLSDQIRQVVREELAQGAVIEQMRGVVREELAQGAVTEQMRRVVRDEQYRWLGSAVSLLVAAGGVGISVATSESAARILDSHGDWLGPAITIVALIFMRLLLGRR